jgi:uncharacterized protein (DUF433 family)
MAELALVPVIFTLAPRNPALTASSAKLFYLEVLMDSAIVTRDPEIMSGALCFAGTRVPVKNLFDYLEGSSSLVEFLEDFPSVSRDRAVAVLEAARQSLAADAPAA